MNSRSFDSKLLLKKVEELKSKYPSLSKVFSAIYGGELDLVLNNFKNHPKMSDQTFFRGVENVFSLEALKKGSMIPPGILDAIVQGKIFIPNGYKNNTPEFLSNGQDKYLQDPSSIRSHSVSLHEEVLFALAQYLLFEEDKGDFTIAEVFTNMYKIDNKFSSYFFSSWVRGELKTQCFNYFVKTGEVIDYSEIE